MAAPSEPAATPPVVMTVGGPVPAEEVLACGPALCREWLLSDQAALLQPRGSAGGVAGPPGGGAAAAQPARGDLVELRNLAAMRRWPLAALHNVHCSRDDALRELGGPLKRRPGGCGLVVVATPRAFWAPAAPADRAQALRALASDLGPGGVRLVAGTAPAPGSPADEGALEAEVARLVTDLAVGFQVDEGDAGDRVRPGVIGELPLWDPALGAPAAADVLALRACVRAQRASGAPLLLSGPVSVEALAVLEGQGVAGGGGAEACLWEKVAFFDVPPSSPVAPAALAARGARLGFCPPSGAADIAWEPYRGQRPWRTEEAFLAALSAAPADRTLLGSGLRFRTDLTAFGGPGAGHALDLLDAAGRAEAPLRAAATEFLRYGWKPPLPPEEVVHMIKCHWCGAEKKEGDHFSKFDFDYCTPKCLGKHRRAEFAPDRHER